jgi:hypothetical protein
VLIGVGEFPKGTPSKVTTSAFAAALQSSSAPNMIARLIQVFPSRLVAADYVLPRQRNAHRRQQRISTFVNFKIAAER